ncbi:MAG: RelA/SpoT family protein [Bacteroidales bacterium]|jgi:GTP pyrophosphokinase|nr:RelA/SpoT family protein [Bacteroidales bacterium]NMD02852.1 bifunctional (p)ppGpp synthetase/guanosine-3',5'-bis(diphosphate) 3'-pyrophosphohydrolase [Bacteroidales bacterium]OQB65584.1 MAG: Guanosine-3',5'-bis(diphosphate) 3'-pyrophosphohydrolase [Bacteroidetes bacterium ADurb.Bin145]
MRTQKLYSGYKGLLLVAKNTIAPGDTKKIRKALDLAASACGDNVTLTGELQIQHALSVARIVAEEMGLGVTSIVTAILHDSYNKLDISTKELEKEFGSKVVEILDGFSRITGIDSMHSSYQAENFRKLLLSLADDVRVILIKLVERLEYMRNLDNAPEKERMPMASETYFLYAPLAHRLGFYNIKSEMEDLSIKYLEPEQYRFIENRLKQTTASRNRLIREFSAPIQEKLEKTGFRFTIKSRTKSIHSIMTKMKKQGVEFEEVFDIFAVRIIIDSENNNDKADCWRVYSIVTDLYQPNPSRLRDWISVPKSNGYESLHTTVIGPRGRWVEVQIRSRRMDEIAEKGLAAHFKYKGLKGEGGLDTWLTKIRELLESSDKEDKEFLDNVRSGLYTDEVFVFTPKGDLRQLPAGATVLDFAFDIHTALGSSCVGGKVNGKNVPLRYVLQNGDHVDVIRSKNQRPKRDWLSIVVTNKARTKIKLALNEERAKAAAEGKEILMRRLKNWKIPYGDTIIQRLINHYNFKTAQDLYYSIESGKLELLEIKDILLKEESTGGVIPPGTISEKETRELFESQFSDFLSIEDKVEGLDYKLSKCCNPVPGDSIFGFVTISEGIKIHRTACPNAHNMLARYPYRVISARWTKSKSGTSFIATIKVTGVEDIGIVNKISEVITGFNATVRSFNYNMEEGMFEGTINLLVANNDMLYGIIRKIHSIKGILKVNRQNN